MKKLLFALATAAGASAPGTAHAITYNYLAGVVHETDAFASFNTTGAQMTGVGVSVLYSDGSTSTASWQAFNATFGGVNTSGIPFFLQTGNTSSTAYPWTFANNHATLSVRSLSLDGQPGNTVFDTGGAFGAFVGFSFVGTPGTSTGLDFDLHSSYRTLYDGATITYSDAVALAGDAPVGDIFRRLTIEFASDRLLGPNRIIQFRQDTDSLAFGSVLAPVSANVPEGGATALMLGAGLVGLMACARSRGRAQA